MKTHTPTENDIRDGRIAALESRDAEINRLRKALEEICDTPHSMVNDSESLRHTLRLIDNIARAAISKASTP